MKNVSNKLIVFLTLALVVVTTVSADEYYAVAVDFDNPSVSCRQADRDDVFSPSGFIQKIEDGVNSFSFEYGLMDGKCKEGRWQPRAGGVLLYERATLRSNLGPFSGVKLKKLVKVRDSSFEAVTNMGGIEEADSIRVGDDGSIYLYASNSSKYSYTCFSEEDDQIFMGNQQCSEDIQGIARKGKIVSLHRYEFTLDKTLLRKALSKKPFLLIHYQIQTRTERRNYSSTRYVINMMIKIRKDNTGKLYFSLVNQ